MYGRSQLRRNHQRVVGLLGKNRIPDRKEADGEESGVIEGKWTTGSFTHWTKCNSGSCYFTSDVCSYSIAKNRILRVRQRSPRTQEEPASCWGREYRRSGEITDFAMLKR
ncbi:hypothetical protein EVAR_6521_1 [Eumeta japonica]|uniref:Uncharacterized protein n=1 Tax=Eumeta variegata TaxID=151549 RepID=A0A4C1SSW9_EUMVA|nr:hypothetical protein EVAR_6521_1 [Eumeta japonica]